MARTTIKVPPELANGTVREHPAPPTRLPRVQTDESALAGGRALKAVGAAADTNAALNPLVALIGIRALYPQQARMLPLEAIDFRHRRVVVAGIDRPLHDFTRQAAADYLRRWHARLASDESDGPAERLPSGGCISFCAACQRRHNNSAKTVCGRQRGRSPSFVPLFNIVPETGLRYVRPLWPTPN